MNRYIVGGIVSMAVLVSAALPAGACDVCGGGDISDAGIRAQARAEMAELNAGYSGGPPNCTDEHELVPEDGNDVVEYEGYLRWVPDFANDPTPPDGVSNEWYRRICYLPDMPPRDGLARGFHGRRFENVEPEVLAQVAIEDVFTDIGTHTISTSPVVDNAMVGIPTWFWAENLEGDGETAVAEIPGVRVVATARPGGVNYDFGDGTTLGCAGTGTPYAPGATSDCTHTYETAGHYTVTATVLWTGSYTINGGPPIPIEAAIERTATFDLTVNEAQAINTRPGG